MAVKGRGRHPSFTPPRVTRPPRLTLSLPLETVVSTEGGTELTPTVPSPPLNPLERPPWSGTSVRGVTRPSKRTGV